MNNQLEKLPEIARNLTAIDFDEGLNKYKPKDPVLIENAAAALYVNGAWYAYQEQQKRIDEMKADKAEHIERMNKLLGVKK